MCHRLWVCLLGAACAFALDASDRGCTQARFKPVTHRRSVVAVRPRPERRAMTGLTRASFKINPVGIRNPGTRPFHRFTFAPLPNPEGSQRLAGG